VPLETMQRTVNGWKKAGGEVEMELYRGANHGFMTGKPNAPYARNAIERMKSFIRKHTG
jgi:dienelactone hydrolase